MCTDYAIDVYNSFHTGMGTGVPEQALLGADSGSLKLTSACTNSRPLGVLLLAWLAESFRVDCAQDEY